MAVLSPALDPALAGGHGHLVEFYETEPFLVDTVRGFVAPALRADETVLMVATAEHRRMFEASLRNAGVDIDGAVRIGRYRSLDAADVLSRFMVDGAPDAARFRTAITAIMDSAPAGGRGMRVYGEMVALLWDEGDAASALTLEDLWNDLARQRTFALLCAYPLRAFEGDASGQRFVRLCGQHDTVIPSEGYSLLTDPAERTRAIARLQQQAATLRASEERFRRSFDEARIGMVIIDLDGRYERVNDAFCSIVGHSQQQLTGLSRAVITHPDDISADLADVRSLLAGEASAHRREKRYLHASGQVVWTEVHVSLVRDADGRPLRLIAQVQDITERLRQESLLRYMADHDALTGSLNRRSFERELAGHAARAHRYGVTGAVLMLDLDHFKYFNDTHGHSAGDRLIVGIAHDLQSRLRASDVLARLGGDEFAVLLPGEDERTARAVAETLLQVVRDQALPALLGGHRGVTASIGVACFDDGEHLTPEDMMINADLAMYDAKEAGRDRVMRYRPDQRDRPRIESDVRWRELIHAALAEDGFELHAQPIMPLVGDGPGQYELLLRMRGRDGSLVPPGSFLYIAEHLGLARQIDHWVTRRAIDMLAEHRAAGRDLRFDVNLSGLTIGDDTLLELIERRLTETGVPPDRLILEVTETAAVTHVGRATRFATRLTGLGCGFALDDFGAGFGSFHHLKQLPFDYLKIDGGLVRQCDQSETDRVLISAVVQIARGMGRRTIAECITSRETAEILARLGVDYGQGFHIGRPAPLDDHLRALGERSAS